MAERARSDAEGTRYDESYDAAIAVEHEECT